MNRLEKMKLSLVETKNMIDQVFLRNAYYSDLAGVLDKPYEKSDLVYVCISTTAKAIAQVPIIVMKNTTKGWVAVPENDPDQLTLNNPNPLMPTTFEFVNALVSHLLLSGHVWILPFPPNGSGIDALWLIKRSNMEKLVDERTNQLVGWNYMPSKGKSVILSPDEVASIKFFNPTDDIMGLSPMEAGRLPIATDYKTASYNEKFFDDGAVPGGIISTDNKLNETAFQRLKSQFEDRHSGYKKSHRLAILDSGLKYTQMGLSQKDMEFPELRRMNRESIMQVFGMKKIIISVTENLNYATARVERQEWWQSTNLPLMQMISSGLTKIFYGNNPARRIIFDTSNVDALHEDFATKVDTAEKLFKIGFAPNEINDRLNLGFDFKPWREFWFVPSNIVRVNEDGTLDTTGINPQLPGPNPPPEPVEEPENEPEETEEESLSPLQIAHKDSTGYSEQDELFYGNYWAKLMSSAQSIEWDFEVKVRKIFFDIRKKALKLWFKAQDDLEKEDFSDDKKRLSMQTVDIYEAALRLGANSILNEIGGGVSFNINDPEVIHFLQVKPIMVGRIVNTVREQLRQTIIDGVSLNESMEQIATRIKKVMSNAHRRAMTIAVTEVGSALNYSRYREIRDNGFLKKKWYTALDERVRANHREMHGKVIGVNDMWIVGGASLRFPGDPNGPAKEIINCRCVELPVKE